MRSLKFPLHALYVIMLFVLQSSVFSSVLWDKIGIDFILLYIVYLSFFASPLFGLLLLTFSCLLMFSASALPFSNFLLMYLFIFILIKYLINSSISLTQTSITTLTAISFGITQILFLLISSPPKDSSVYWLAPIFVIGKIVLNTVVQPFLFMPLQWLDAFFHEKYRDEQHKEDFFFKTSWWRST